MRDLVLAEKYCHRDDEDLSPRYFAAIRSSVQVLPNVFQVLYGGIPTAWLYRWAHIDCMAFTQV